MAKGLSGLPDARFVTDRADQFVYSRQLVFVSGVMTACVLEFVNGIVGGVGYSDCGVLE
jgi:hypothetical protein